MFGSKKTETVTSATPAAPKSTSTASSSSALNSIVSGTKIEGKVHCENDIRIDGHLKGCLLYTSRCV